jgi:phage head maturation protease
LRAAFGADRGGDAGTQTYAAFEAFARTQGFDEVLERRWPAGTALGAHAHAFAVLGRVVEGELWLTVDGVTRHLRAGDEFALPRDVLHEERYGAAGAVVWVARWHAAG